MRRLGIIQLGFAICTLWTAVTWFGCEETRTNRHINDSKFNDGWLFIKGTRDGAEKAEYDDSGWQSVDLPHDWAIEGPFSSKYNARTGGLPVHGTGWYRKHFAVDPSMSNKRISVLFDGAMSNAQVWINGKQAGSRPYGYIGFEVDLTPFIHFGQENVLAVKLSPEDLAARWYTGAGIYRNVWIKYNEPIFIPTWGTFISTPKVTDASASVHLVTDIMNSSDVDQSVELSTEILDSAGSVMTSQSDQIELEAYSKSQHTLDLVVHNPRRWDISDPYRYQVRQIIKNGTTVLDESIQPFGIRTIKFTSNDGFLLNDRRVQLNGVCMHHDLGPLGAGVNYRATERQMEIMKSMGVNALRTSHNPPSPEMLEVCDKLGIVVQVEAFDEWKIGKVPNGYNKYFDEWHEQDLRDMIKRDRNHPSVIMWSIGNEILEQGRKDGWKVAKLLNDICHDEDPTRPTTAGFNYYPASFENKLAYQVDLVGLNYKPLDYKEAKNNNPDMIIYGSETSSQTSSRGVYHLPVEHDFQKETGHVSSYDVVVGPKWAYPPDAEFDVQEQHDFLLGEFIWTGFDYFGEPTPYGGRDNSTDGYWNADWPSRSSYFAPVDLCGFPKDRYYLYQSQWTAEPMVHVLPHWNWEGMEGQKIPVYAYTNTEEVELIVNGKSLGRKRKGHDLTPIPAEYRGFEKGTFMSKYRLSWEVPYVPGSLKVVAYNNAKPVAEKEIRTAGLPAKVSLIPDRTVIRQGGEDLCFITVRIEDAEGNLCPMSDNLVKFIIEGEGKLAAVGNGNQRSLESFRVPQRKAFSGQCLLVVRSGKEQGEIVVTATSEDLIGSNVLLTVN